MPVCRATCAGDAVARRGQRSLTPPAADAENGLPETVRQAARALGLQAETLLAWHTDGRQVVLIAADGRKYRRAAQEEESK